ncbi:MAG: cation-transporting P-type ATPase [Caldilinea sp. CFX5]|nr:cation-transporting P-type ATPase [Caldilinea sp. CFX5]
MVSSAETLSLGATTVGNTTAATTDSTCALCHLPARRTISATFQEETHYFCCYGCRHIYELVAPNLAQGLSLAAAMGAAGLDLNAPCCRGALHGDPVEEARKTLARLMFNAFLTMMVMALSVALYSEFFFTWDESGQGLRSMLQVLSMVFATPAVLLLAIPILEDAVLTFQVYRRLTMSALIAFGTLAAYALSVYATFTGRGHAYFETAGMTLLLVTLGRWLDARTQIEGNRALEELLARAPTTATRINADGREEQVALEAIRVGEQVRVRPGENFAVDGVVRWGEGSVNEASITGESVPAHKSVGATVYAGSLNIDGSFIIDVTQVGEDRVMGKLVRLLDEARLYRAPIERLADRIAGYFVPIVFVIAVATFLYWYWQVGFEAGLLNSLSVVLIACPCALGVATPLTVWIGLSRAAQRGILIRNSFTLEKLSRLRRLFFDKTGTLTTGDNDLTDIILDPAETMTATQLLQLVASVEQASEHPLARSIGAAAQRQGIALLPVDQFQNRPGLGITGAVNGQTLLIGNWRLLQQETLTLAPALAAERQQLENNGFTLVFVAWAGKVRGLLALRETIRPSATAALAALTAQKLTPVVLTGDSAAAAAALGRRLQVAVRAELLPTDKVNLVAQAEAEGTVAMVGDGLNDAPALARASVGIALGCGADVTREAADVSLLGADLQQIPWLLALARRTYRTIQWNLLWAFIYNVVGIGLAISGNLHPLLAAVAMVLSSVWVVGNALRLRNFQ